MLLIFRSKVVYTTFLIDFRTGMIWQIVKWETKCLISMESWAV